MNTSMEKVTIHSFIHFLIQLTLDWRLLNKKNKQRR